MQGYMDKVQNPMLVPCALSEKLNLNIQTFIKARHSS